MSNFKEKRKQSSSAKQLAQNGRFNGSKIIITLNALKNSVDRDFAWRRTGFCLAF